MGMLARAGTDGMAAYVIRMTVRAIGITLTLHQTDRWKGPVGTVRTMAHRESGT